MRVLVVQHEAGAGAGLVGSWLAAAGARLLVEEPFRGSPLPDPDVLDSVDALLVLGGSVGAHDDHDAPWLPATRTLLAAAVERDLPTLAVCLGAQLLAVACGGSARPAAGPPEIGVERVDVHPAAADDPVLGPLAGRGVPAVQWHFDEVDVLPPGARVLASSDAFPHQAYRLGRSAWGLQFHPEVTTEIFTAWADGDFTDLVALGLSRDDLVAAAAAAEDELARTWRPMVAGFAAVVREHAAGRGTEEAPSGARRPA